MEQYNIHEAKTHLSALLEKAAGGEEFVIAKAGKPMVKVIPYEKTAKIPRVGFLKDQITIPNDFDRASEAEIAALFGEDQ